MRALSERAAFGIEAAALCPHPPIGVIVALSQPDEPGLLADVAGVLADQPRILADVSSLLANKPGVQVAFEFVIALDACVCYSVLFEALTRRSLCSMPHHCFVQLLQPDNPGLLAYVAGVLGGH